VGASTVGALEGDDLVVGASEGDDLVEDLALAGWPRFRLTGSVSFTVAEVSTCC
jgi:hypothetical protein